MYTKTFKEISYKDIDVAGGKGASLGEMTKAGIPVPPGFVITVDSFDKFLEETDLIVEIASQIKQINYKDINSVRKAKAIITNEGGIACHVAIVYRELGIPCIIGTKITTKALRDGDLVEMDIKTGIVRVLKR